MKAKSVFLRRERLGRPKALTLPVCLSSDIKTRFEIDAFLEIDFICSSAPFWNTFASIWSALKSLLLFSNKNTATRNYPCEVTHRNILLLIGTFLFG